MKIEIKITSTPEVKFQSQIDAGWIIDEKKGLFRLNLIQFESDINRYLVEKKYGDSVNKYYWGFEIGVLSEWITTFSKTKDYVSYRPKLKGIVSVSQIDWHEINKKSFEEQFHFTCNMLLDSILRIEKLKRKPKSFDYKAFLKDMNEILINLSKNQKEN